MNSNVLQALCEAEGVSSMQRWQSAFPQEASITMGEINNIQYKSCYNKVYEIKK